MVAIGAIKALSSSEQASHGTGSRGASSGTMSKTSTLSKMSWGSSKVQVFTPGTVQVQEQPKPHSAKGGTMIKAYCGAKPLAVLPAEQSERGEAGPPAPAWADVGLASHFKAFALPPKEQGDDLMAVFHQQFLLRMCAWRACLTMTSIAENIACYLAYLEVREPGERFYNKLQAHMLLAPGLDRVLLGLAAFNSAYLLLFWAFVLGLRVSDNHAFGTFAVARLALSIACFFACATLVAFAESSKVWPFVGTVTVLLNIDVIILGRLLFTARTHCVKVLHVLLICFILVVVLSWCLLFSFDLLGIVRASCPATNNLAMPVHVDGTEWACVKWGETVQLIHVLNASEGIFNASCTSSFDAVPGIPDGNDVRAHLISCPPGCASSRKAVIGCRFYDSSSSVCRSAIQMGVLDNSQGGVVKVVRRPPLPVWYYSPCSFRGILSSAATSASGRAFYFQGAAGMDIHDSVTLESWQDLDVVQDGSHWQPWTNFEANVTWVLGGGEPQRQVVAFGPKTNVSDKIEVNFCNAVRASPSRCA